MLASTLLADKSKWTQGAPARDSVGVEVSEHDKSAVCWSMYGVLGKMYPFPRNMQAYTVLYNHLIKVYGVEGVQLFNDTHTHEEVVSILKELKI